MRSDLGHRQRVKQRFRDEGLEHFDETHALELLLFYAVPRRDTKPLARRLLDTFGSYAKVLEADEAALRKVEGVGEGVATYLRLIHASSRYYIVKNNKHPQSFSNLCECGGYLTALYHGLNKERVYLLCLNARSELICTRQITEGTVNSAEFPIRKLLDAAMSSGAVSVILSHNHPDGLLQHSQEDISFTRRIAKALHAADIILVDHIIVAGGNYISLAETGIYDYRRITL